MNGERKVQVTWERKIQRRKREGVYRERVEECTDRGKGERKVRIEKRKKGSHKEGSE
jgi:hypothetical protein